MKVIPGLPDPLWPAKLKNGHFWEFLDFSTNKKYANVKIEGSQIEWLSTSFTTIPKLCGFDRAPLSYDPGLVQDPKTWIGARPKTNVIWCTYKINL